MRKFGLIGYPLSHSFSKKYFNSKFEQEGISDCFYELYPLKTIEELPELLANTPDLEGLNVTIPYKQAVIPFLQAIEKGAEEVGAVNVIKIENGQLIGYNSDIYGFEQSLLDFLGKDKNDLKRALILGSGGAAKAVSFVLKKMKIDYKIVSRTPKYDQLIYEQLTPSLINRHLLLINTTPLGMAPNSSTYPDLPYQYLSDKHYLFDLVYNPEKTLFLAKGEQNGAKTCNGLKMLYLQAEKAWEIWNN